MDWSKIAGAKVKYEPMSNEDLTREMVRLSHENDDLTDTVNELRLDLESLIKKVRRMEAEGVPMRTPSERETVYSGVGHEVPKP